MNLYVFKKSVGRLGGINFIENYETYLILQKLMKYIIEGSVKIYKYIKL